MARRRTQESYHNSLRPGLLANGVIGALILAGIGMTYAWVGWQKKECGDRNNATRHSIEQLTRTRQALQVRMKSRLDGAELRRRVGTMDLGLMDIPPSSLFEVADSKPADAP